ncbi:MAG: hypothetical protein WA151_16500, partial [Desulfatirhabdiaceae bacterium]
MIFIRTARASQSSVTISPLTLSTMIGHSKYATDGNAPYFSKMNIAFKIEIWVRYRSGMAKKAYPLP